MLPLHNWLMVSVRWLDIEEELGLPSSIISGVHGALSSWHRNEGISIEVQRGNFFERAQIREFALVFIEHLRTLQGTGDVRTRSHYYNLLSTLIYCLEVSLRGR